MPRIFLPIMGFAALLMAGCQSSTPQLTELNDHFTYHGQPVNPRAVEDLTAWISDEHPGPVAIDLSGTEDSNRYYGEVWQRNGMVGFYTPDEGQTVFGSGMFAYKHIGRLSNGAHVLKTIWDGGGSGVFESILVVKFVTEPAFDESGKPYPRTEMRQLGEYPMGDRVNANVKVQGNTVVWTAQGGDPVVIQFK